MTFTLPGFNTVRSEGIELTGAFTATINVEMRVGELQETVTVTGESPIVDVQSARRQQVVDRDALTVDSHVAHVPQHRRPRPGHHGQRQPGRRRHRRPSVVTFSAYGGRGGEGRLQVDGVGVGGNTAGTLVLRGRHRQRAGGHRSRRRAAWAKSEVGGPVINVVPRTGGNTLRGSLFANGANDGMQGDNYTDELRAIGSVATPRA